MAAAAEQGSCLRSTSAVSGIRGDGVPGVPGHVNTTYPTDPTLDWCQARLVHYGVLWWKALSLCQAPCTLQLTAPLASCSAHRRQARDWYQ
jgi:hypothetical protein